MSTSLPASAQQSGTKDLTVTRTFDAPVEKVFKAWSESELVKKWWQPDGFTTPVANMDFKVGGKSLLCMRSPDGHDMYNTWTYSKIVPNERIEFVLNFSDKDGNKLDPAKIGMPPGLPADVRHVITFKSVGDNKTEVTVKEYGYGSDEIVEMSKAGLEQCLNKMATALK
ncbi:SRPBCC domain-containing protein [Paraflavitalea soli]|uniref:SRPBCC domain-containing protein n=1 Tax=Paraflavitalea soli TaxID=2315862 RepID=A0A3B7MVM8_9BACT|nr:SRPBCC domain-containing protein [Paraflavitalea soli]AXY78524.1 SRPBCC domain-containing protein [Paraflavitalea soli]